MIYKINANLKKLGFIVLGGAFFFIFLGFFQLIVGFLGIAEYLGMVPAILFLIGLFYFRFTLPFVIGTFFGIVGVLDWNWVVALILTLPGLIFVLPSLSLLLFAPFIAAFGFGPSKNASTTTDSPQQDDDIIEGTAVHVDEDVEGK